MSDTTAPESELEYAHREVIAAAERWLDARVQRQIRHDLMGDLQMALRAAEQDLDDMTSYLRQVREGRS